jgi:glycosyltransferase involved in cell wall biosynthesis
MTGFNSLNISEPCFVHVDQESFPLITIAITSFNASTTIERAIDSALSQDWPNFEVVIVDDGSTDGSLKILEKKAATDSRLRVIQHPSNRGCAAARNTLVMAARGKFLAFFDDDDISRADRLRLQHNCIISHERNTGAKLVACYASGQRVYPNGFAMTIRAVGADGVSPVGHVMADYLLFNKRCVDVFYGAGTPTCSLMARTTVFYDLGGFDEAMRRQEDVDFAIRFAFKEGHFIGIPEPVLTQYATLGGEKAAHVEFESFLHLLDKNANYLRANHSFRYMQLWSKMRYWHFAGHDARSLLVLLHLMLVYPVRTSRHLITSGISRYCHEKRIGSHG